MSKTDPLEEAFKELHADESIPPHDQMPKGEGYLQIRTMLEPISISFNGKRPDFVFHPPQHSFKIHVKEKDDQIAARKIMTMVLKMRNYLAFPVGTGMGFAYILNSKSIYTNSHMDGGSSFFFLAGNEFPSQIREPEKYKEKWVEKTNALYSYLDDYLKKVEPGSTLDNVNNLMGKSIVIGDMELAFVIQWNAMELLARSYYNDKINEYKEGDSDSINLYLEILADKMVKGSDTRLWYSDKLFAMTQAMGIQLDLKKLDEFREVRNKIVHEIVADSDILSNSSLYQEFYNNARNITFKALINEGVKVPSILM